MKPLFVAFVIGIALGFSLALVDSSFTGFFTARPAIVGVTYVEPIFSPGSQNVFENMVRNARNSIELEVYTFSSQPLEDELAAAVARGVDVRVILEGSISSNFPKSRELLAKGVKVKWGSSSFSLTHSKFIIIDGETVIVGSNNWTFHSFNLNREASVKIQNAEVAGKFVEIFNADWEKGVNAS
ncbi:MAG: phospholipase D-like domain-containing protein [Candidatus Micrarchaeota archaeon]|nr:phospholipase D-like domain-containing protein [Candidatus Micrarchaeota archaeon]